MAVVDYLLEKSSKDRGYAMIKSPPLNDDEDSRDSSVLHVKPAELAENLLFQLQSIRQTLQCSICIETFQKPHTLQCGHTFCGPCLKQVYLLDSFDKANYKHCSTNSTLVALRDLTSVGQSKLADTVDFHKQNPFMTGEIWDPIFAEPEPLCSTRISEDTTFNSTNTIEQFDTFNSTNFTPTVESSTRQVETDLNPSTTEVTELPEPALLMRWDQTDATSTNVRQHHQRTNTSNGLLDYSFEQDDQGGHSSFLGNDANESYIETSENQLVARNISTETGLGNIDRHRDSGSRSSSTEDSGPLDYLDRNSTRGNPNIYCSSPIIPPISPPLESFLHGASEIIPDNSSVQERFSISQCPNCGWDLSRDNGASVESSDGPSIHSNVSVEERSSWMTEDEQTFYSDGSSVSSNYQSTSPRYQPFSDGDSIFSISHNFNSDSSQETLSDQNNEANTGNLEDTSSSSIYSTPATQEYNQEVNILIDRSSGLFSNMWDSALGQSEVQMNPSFLELGFLGLHDTLSQSTLSYDSDGSESHTPRSAESGNSTVSSND
ncbi:hypothetical protein K493DRAFT_298865 [Basidiobolus meristosporus CBS 931.73]|uniref:RING-type domain-containing protein n=1 Tax=Basidiobolus meristosporus CBS 931.73 TaxID=1314790 RepID=A0A1Y1YRY7_9FUNG|nr:hypothetical protein K493DRAFT_298865 [Basidiobolus meristosporus CBS 931.73]|eukprot:ORY00507.1 hypothetical protein K493DRAFT_298865 [Basidiobolus meristosporus CBS 931.73]